MHRSRSFVLAAALAVIVPCAVAADRTADAATHPSLSGQSGTRVVRDNLDRSVAIPARVRRVLSLQPEITRLIVALGAGENLVGIDHFLRSNDPLFPIVFPAAANLPIVSRADYNVNLETVARLAPDVIFAAPEDQRIVRALEDKTGIPTVALASLGRFDRLRGEIRMLGEILGRSGRADEILRLYDDVLDPIRKKTSGLPPDARPRIYLAFWGEKTRTPVAYEPVDAAGGTNVAANLLPSFLGTLIASVGIERILAWDPDLILVQGNYPPSQRRVTTESFRADPRFRSIRAVRQGRVRYTFGFWNWWDPAEALVETAYLAALFHPDLFPDFSLEKSGNAVFRAVYGRDGLFSALSDVLGCREWVHAR
ncbi:MAG: ABC transporter substrate-binding protein [Candidatus Aminicenantes bacterium]|nr:ABC transporter substrate-binding protein [Candidatus Aminicenantes bacterium]